MGWGTGGIENRGQEAGEWGTGSRSSNPTVLLLYILASQTTNLLKFQMTFHGIYMDIFWNCVFSQFGPHSWLMSSE